MITVLDRDGTIVARSSGDTERVGAEPSPSLARLIRLNGPEGSGPTVTIEGALDLMDLRNDDAGRRERGIMRRQVAHLKHLVDDLLDVSRIASGKLRSRRRRSTWPPLRATPSRPSPDQPLRLDAPDESWVDGDEHRLAQVLGNLLSNAARFGSTDTHVVLDRAGADVRLVVSDNGVGMDAVQAQRAFEPFYQGQQALVRHSDGPGRGGRWGRRTRMCRRARPARRGPEVRYGRAGRTSPSPGSAFLTLSGSMPCNCQ